MAEPLHLDNLVPLEGIGEASGSGNVNSSLLTNIDHVMSDISNMVTNVKVEQGEHPSPGAMDLQDEMQKVPDFKSSEDTVHVRNPWNFSTLEDFLFYCCPECPHKCRSSISFTKHAVKHHPKVIINENSRASNTPHN